MSIMIREVIFVILVTRLRTAELCETEVVAMGGFLHNVCKGNKHMVKCPFSDAMFEVDVILSKLTRETTISVDQICPEDNNLYQACGLGNIKYVFDDRNFENAEKLLPPTEQMGMFCGILCASSDRPDTLQTEVEQWDHYDNPSKACFTDLRCNMEIECNDNETTALRSGHFYPNSNICDNKCDAPLGEEVWYYNVCEDESYCDGFSYGKYCIQPSGTVIYMAPWVILCKPSHFGCEFDIGEELCNTKNVTTCVYIMDGSEPQYRPLTSFTRCFSFDYMFQLCFNGYDQTNCTDPYRVAFECFIGGYWSSVSKFVVCAQLSVQIPQICDDGIEKSCIEISTSCTIHKHKMCDGVFDCENTADENDSVCSTMSVRKCKRRMKPNYEVEIPISWVNDGVTDCLEGEDEDILWPFCGGGLTKRYKSDVIHPCTEVFLCDPVTGPFVLQDSLCNANSCSREVSTCAVSRLTANTKALNQFGVDVPTFIGSSICNPGTNSLLRLRGTSCEKEKLEFREDFIGKFEQNDFRRGNRHTTKTSLIIERQNSKMGCGYFFGLSYLINTCLKLCDDSICPIDQILPYDACPGQFSDRVFSIGKSRELTFAVRSGNLYHNDYFKCFNNICVTFDKVCNLEDDCGDGSDETSCSNHFKCEGSEQLLVLSQKCDGVVDCIDASDECNKECGRQVINILFLKYVSLAIGLVAVVMNSIVVITNVPDLLERAQSPIAFVNKCLVTVIGIGDFMTGSYVLALFVFDFIYGSSYCTNQLSWLTSLPCEVLGVVSTVGAEVSILSMTLLSLIRCFNIQRSRARAIPSGDVSSTLTVRIGTVVFIIFAMSIMISILPLLSSVEDMFVNGIVIDERNSLLIGTTGKDDLFDILEGYYGRLRSLNGDPMPWSMKTSMLYEMFSKDYQGIKRNPISFYGNDAVCIFKYLVTPSDPQFVFVACVHTLNFVCVILITLSYIGIHISAVASTKAVFKSGNLNFPSRSRSQGLSRKITAIITTDLICWLPLQAICILHAADIIDATTFYSILSIVFLPLNSAINPLLYNSTITSCLSTIKTVVRGVVRRVIDRLLFLLGWSDEYRSDTDSAPPTATAQRSAQDTYLETSERSPATGRVAWLSFPESTDSPPTTDDRSAWVSLRETVDTPPTADDPSACVSLCETTDTPSTAESSAWVSLRETTDIPPTAESSAWVSPRETSETPPTAEEREQSPE